LGGGSPEIVYGKMFRREGLGIAGRTGDSGNSRLLALIYFPVVGLDMDMMEGGEDR